MTGKRRKSPAEPTVTQFDALVTQLYAAATDPELWPSALKEMVRFVGNSGVHLFLTDETTGLVRQDAYYGMPEKLMVEYNNGQVIDCPRVKNALAHPEYRLLYDYQHIDERGINQSEYYHWLQASGDGIRYYLGAQLFPTKGRPSWISFPFRRSEGHAQRTHMNRLKLFVPHLERALRVSQQFGTAISLSGALEESINSQRLALVVLGASGNVLFASRETLELARNATWFRLSSAGIHLSNPRLDLRLQSGLQDCQQLIKGCVGPTAKELTVRTDEGACFQFSVAPLMFQGRSFGVDVPTVIVTITRLAVADANARSRLKELTAAELALTLAIAHGTTLAAHARERKTSIHTVRAQLKAIFQKTGTHRQAELVSLVLERGPTPVSK